MEKTILAFKVFIAFICSLISVFLGGWDIALAVLICFTVIDFLTGIACGICLKKLSSSVMIRGGFKKLGIYLSVAIAVQLDRIINLDVMFRTLFIGYYIATEGLSVFENLAVLGVPFPPFVTNVLEQLKEKCENKGEL